MIDVLNYAFVTEADDAKSCDPRAGVNSHNDHAQMLARSKRECKDEVWPESLRKL